MPTQASGTLLAFCDRDRVVVPSDGDDVLRL